MDGAGVSVVVRMVRHGRAAAGWDTDPDPGLDDLGQAQATAVAARLAGLGPLSIVSSPLQRCQQTAAVLAATWDVQPVVDSTVAEIPSPIGVPMGERIEWLRRTMAGEWASLDERYTAYRDSIAAWVAARPSDTIVFSHFVAINAAIGAATGDDRVVIASLDNCSVTTFEVGDDGTLRLLEIGNEADTLIR